MTSERQTHYEWSGETPVSVAIARAIAAERGVRPSKMTPLASYVDAEAIDDVFASTRTPATAVTFTYEDLDVTVSAEGTITLRRRQAETETAGDAVAEGCTD